ncbi:MAG: HI0074 family nucleotidyltransferase substrate-binding subunit [Campylobacterota bacterium]|nr:HI0074 family nucleotidyltransferase substrate-binding subunit [Campylobacterota bacterium]
MSVQITEAISNLDKRLKSLKSAITKYHKKLGTDEEEDYLELIIKRFESSDETAKKLMKVYLNYLGETSELPANKLFKKAHEYSFIDNDTWFEMNNDRNKTTHEYDEVFAKELAEKVIDTYIIIIENFYNSIVEDYQE